MNALQVKKIGIVFVLVILCGLFYQETAEPDTASRVARTRVQSQRQKSGSAQRSCKKSCRKKCKRRRCYRPYYNNNGPWVSWSYGYSYPYYGACWGGPCGGYGYCGGPYYGCWGGPCYGPGFGLTLSV